METKVSYTLVGLFIIALGATLVAVVLWLGKGTYGTVYETYYTYMRESVSGLSPNAPVKYRGVDVGQVREIALNPSNPEEVRLTLEVVSGTPIKQDTRAILVTQGLTGLASINLTGGSKESPPLTAKPGEPYAVIESGPSLFFRLDEALSRVLADETLPRLLANLNRLTEQARTVIGDENRVAMTAILKDLAQITRTLATRSEQMDQGVVRAAEAMAKAAKITDTLGRQMPEIIERVNRAAAALENMTQELARAGTKVSAAVDQTKPDIEQFARQTLPETGLLIGELRQLTASLRRVAAQLERQPNSLIFGRPPVPPGPGE
jgi:phospholipid/cholesterol/gamma-HCH transport system substrate-binding protein